MLIAVGAHLPFLVFVLIDQSLADQSSLHIDGAATARRVGVDPNGLHQCKAWRTWYNSQNSGRPLSADDVSLVADRRRRTRVESSDDLETFELPSNLLENVTSVVVDWDEVCRDLPRDLWINSTVAAKRYNVNITDLCLDERLAEIEEWSAAATNTSVGGNVSTAIMMLSEWNEAKNWSMFESLSPFLWSRYERVGLLLSAICGPVALNRTSSDLSLFEDEWGSLTAVGTAVASTGRSLDSSNIISTFTYDFALDNLLSLFGEPLANNRPLPASFLLPLLKAGYDKRSNPALFSNQTVVVRVGLFLQSLSDFELTTMDYNSDVWLRLAWRDVRLAHGLAQPVLLNDLSFLNAIWRPATYLANAKHARLHKVSYLNAYSLVFPDGEVLLEMRLHLKLTCHLQLCKFPHDSQLCAIRVASMGEQSDALRLQWWTEPKDALRAAFDLQLPELHVVSLRPRTECRMPRKTGNYSCVLAEIELLRESSYYVALTYLPTAICVIFSWISVWLPEEFVEGRVFVAITVFLTLSAESKALKETLPKVSYVKAIDYWFGFSTLFVFSTMMQSLFVISLEYASRADRKIAEGMARGESASRDGVPVSTASLFHQISSRLGRARRLHERARRCDVLCRSLYPLAFLVFLIFYAFVITQGDDDHCLRSTQHVTA